MLFVLVLSAVVLQAGASSSREVLETQQAVCQITTEELVATAQATVTRVLKGLCNAKEMEDRFHNLEAQLGDQLNVLKTMLLNMEDKLQEQDQANKRAHRRMMTALLRACPNGNNGKSSGVADTTAWDGENTTDAPETDDEDDDGDSEGPRAAELMRYNSTIHKELGGHHVFTYYWRVRHMEYKLTGWDPRRSLRSPSFYVSQGGYRMYLRLHPRQGGENVYVHAGLTRGDFDQSLSWPFKLKLRVHVLDQATDSTEDVVSRLWDPMHLCSGFNWQRPVSGDNYECVGLGFPQDVLRSRSYIWNDSIVVKLTVFLD
ncbi:uncharacterized protein [Anabrus simplex]|uniref:uncharacterized protein n=1 Tax=Anabrus simplex TaxID=316456 RepID=UPI0035A26FD8